MSKPKRKLGDQIRQAVDDSGLSRYAICKATRIDQGGFSHFMAGKAGLTLANLDLVADLIGLGVTLNGKPVGGRKSR